MTLLELPWNLSSGSDPSVLGKGYKVRAVSGSPEPHIHTRTHPHPHPLTFCDHEIDVHAGFIKWIGKT